MWTYLFICSWFSVGGIGFFIMDAYKKSNKTRIEYLVTLFGACLYGYVTFFVVVIALFFIYLSESEWWNEEV